MHVRAYCRPIILQSRLQCSACVCVTQSYTVLEAEANITRISRVKHGKLQLLSFVLKVATALCSDREQLTVCRRTNLHASATDIRPLHRFVLSLTEFVFEVAIVDFSPSYVIM